ncbi:hypothetical protein GCM10010324_66800 [Streptomyces hiroshimensis]|uniref:Gram-positive cocci surface proteins LPxTG domain-containing protein n=2 Tax=Streptomyces hiroshimensis TaxID=66424 RepID=A0ABQ2ZCF4_9ACTN|nr:hypothetical protein GCM10010324_66800 [Streptomyces hiroshimensis]
MRWAMVPVATLAAGLGLCAGPAYAGARADYQAIAHTIVGRVGETVEVELGVRNGGPGPAGGRPGHGAGTYEVTPPPGTTIVAAPHSGVRQPCVAKASPSAEPGSYVCSIGEDFSAGERETLGFQVRIDRKVDGAEGLVRVLDRDGEPSPDPDPGNDSAPIRVEVVDRAPEPPPAPATNSTLLLATTSGTAVSAGAIALGVTRRRQR